MWVQADGLVSNWLKSRMMCLRYTSVKPGGWPHPRKRRHANVMADSPANITRLLGEVRAGNREAESVLIEAVYGELRQIAGGLLRRERPGHTLQPTALVNEAYLRLLGDATVDWKDRNHFYAA